MFSLIAVVGSRPENMPPAMMMTLSQRMVLLEVWVGVFGGGVGGLATGNDAHSANGNSVGLGSDTGNALPVCVLTVTWTQ